MRIHITGIVQGVGMRPFVYREAVAHGVLGWVLNAGDGVHIEAHAEGAAIEDFIRCLREHAPAASQIDAINVTEMRPTEPEPTFCIVSSQDEETHTTLVSPDIATCDDCLRELFDPSDRRFHYPFINCTNCGPRFTIIRDLPYDRAKTSMGAFPMCPSCADEYADPLNRRFHAQPDACFACGPHITWQEHSDSEPLVGATRESSDAIIERCADLLEADGIVAIKGLGGFHLACRAGSESAVRELRRRKRRSNKPLAVMVRDLATAAGLCTICPAERELLTGSIRPIVLLMRRADRNDEHGTARDHLAPSVVHGLPELGVMLPYTPLQHLLMAACRSRGIDALVMTSGNISEEPIEVDDARAWSRLVERGVADALLGNDRAILSRFDDSVVRLVEGRTQLVRRARGYAPRPIALPTSPTGGPSCVLACGPEQKATLALTRRNTSDSTDCFVSQHIGDLENAETFDAWRAALTRMESLFDLTPSALACDAHPGYLSSQWARERAAKTSLPLVFVQHHHAHIASVLAEAITRGEIESNAYAIGIAFDGTGAGAAYVDTPTGRKTELDGTIWGGEILLASLSSCARIAHLEPWPLPGGSASVRDPRRNAFALLEHYDLLDHPGAKGLVESLEVHERDIVSRMIERGINCPLTSSMGRLLDAISALTGICHTATYEGEPAILLEAAAQRYVQGHMSHKLSTHPSGSDGSTSGGGNQTTASAPSKSFGSTPCDVAPRDRMTAKVAAHANPDTPGSISVKPFLVHLLDGMARNIPVDQLAWEVHQELARITARTVIDISSASGVRTIALSGGVFMNRLLLSGITSALERAGLTVLTPRELPFNDGCIAYGQAAIAHAQLAHLGAGTGNFAAL